MGEVDQLEEIPLPMIVWKFPIRDFTDEDIKNMATSLRVHGQIHPIVCKPPDENSFYVGVCGRLRYEGAKYARLPEILARVHKFQSESEVLDWQLAENLHRKDLTLAQKSQAFKSLYEKRREEIGGIKGKHIVAAIAEAHEKLTGEKKAEDTIRRYIQVAKELPKELMETIGFESDFGLSHARQLLRLKDKPKEQLKLAEKFRNKPLTVRKMKQEVDKILNPKPKPLEPIDTGLVVKCSVCGDAYTLIHIDEGKHKIRKIKVTGE